MNINMLFRRLKSIYFSFGDLSRPLKNQKMLPLIILFLVIFSIALIFSFLSYARVLSPFIYPLF